VALARPVFEMAEAKAARRPRSPSPGCWRRATTSVPIPGTKRLAYLEQNLAALDVRLSAEDVAVSTPSSAGHRTGERYGAAAAALLDS